MASVHVGAPAPPLELPTAEGRQRSLEEFRGRPVLLSFLGAANCLFCRAHVLRLIQARDSISRAGADVLLVVYHDPELVMSKMLADVDVPFVVLVDKAKVSYSRWGLRDASPWARVMPGFIVGVARIILGGAKDPGKVDDSRQTGGDFVIDPTGRIVFANQMKGYHDRATVYQLLSAAQARS